MSSFFHCHQGIGESLNGQGIKKVPHITTLAAATAAVKGIAAYRKSKSGVKSLQRYHSDIK